MARHFATHAWNLFSGAIAREALAPFPWGGKEKQYVCFNIRRNADRRDNTRRWRASVNLHPSPSMRLHILHRLRFRHFGTPRLLQSDGDRHIHRSRRRRGYDRAYPRRKPSSRHNRFFVHHHCDDRSWFHRGQWHRSRELLQWLFCPSTREQRSRDKHFQHLP